VIHARFATVKNAKICHYVNHAVRVTVSNAETFILVALSRANCLLAKSVDKFLFAKHVTHNTARNERLFAISATLRSSKNVSSIVIAVLHVKLHIVLLVKMTLATAKSASNDSAENSGKCSFATAAFLSVILYAEKNQLVVHVTMSIAKRVAVTLNVNNTEFIGVIIAIRTR